VSVADSVANDHDLTRAEKAFLEAVLACHGVQAQPSESDVSGAMNVMLAYAQQVQDNPPEGAPSLIIRRWLSPLSDQDRIKIAATAFVLFGVTKPSIFQVRAAQRQISGVTGA
jgi:hypothetical protein